MGSVMPEATTYTYTHIYIHIYMYTYTQESVMPEATAEESIPAVHIWGPVERALAVSACALAAASSSLL